MKRCPGFVEPNLSLNGFGQNLHALLFRNVYGLVRRLYGLGKVAHLGIGGSKRPENVWTLTAG